MYRRQPRSEEIKDSDQSEESDELDLGEEDDDD